MNPPDLTINKDGISGFKPLAREPDETVTAGEVSLLAWSAYSALLEKAAAYRAMDDDNIAIHADLAEASFRSLPAE